MSSNPSSTTPAIPFIAGPRVYLQPYDEKDVPIFIEWVNDPVCRHYARNMFPHTFESEKKWIIEQSNYSQKAEALGFGIWLREERRIIGSIGLFGLDYASNNCWMGLEIGDKVCWGKRYATEAGRLILGYAFGELGMHKVMVGIYAPNKGSQGAARNLGFRLAGISKEEAFIDGVYVDCFYYELFSDEWIHSLG